MTPAAEPCAMKHPATLDPCGEKPSGYFEAWCQHEHAERFWLCLRHGQEALKGQPAALCERCWEAKAVHQDQGRCRMRVRMLAAA